MRDTRGPLLLVVTARPEFLEQLPGWGARVRGTNVALEALSPEDAVRMLDELLGGTLPLGLGEIVVERAEGNPFFVEELLATLIDRQLLERQNGAWRLAELPSDFAVPDTVQAVVAARIDLLDPAEKQALQAASVIGRIFWAGPVYGQTIASWIPAGPGPAFIVLRSRTERLRFLEPLRTALLAAAAAAVLGAVLLSFLVSRTVTRPLAQITETMREIARTGDFTRKV